MRILHINIGYPPFIGGSQLFLQEVARRSCRRGHEVTAYVSDARENEHIWSPSKERLPSGYEVQCSSLPDEGVAVRRFAIRHLPLSPYSFYALRRLVIELSRRNWVNESTLWHWARFTPWLPGLEAHFQSANDRQCTSLLCDLVHVWNIPFESLWGPAWRYARSHSIPFIATPLLHLGESGSDHVRRFYTMRHQMSLLRDSDAVLALTPTEAEYLVKHGVAEARIHVVSGGVDEARFRQGDAGRFRARYHIQRPFVLYLGALHYEKGATHTVQAMAELWRRGYNTDLVMIGQPMEHFLAFYRRLPGEQQARCHLLGSMDEESKADALAACEMLALPSRTESFGLVYLEAWALGKPVIGARAGAVPAVIREKVDGLLVPFGDVAALAESIAALLDSPALSQALGAAGQREVRQRFTWELVEERLEQVYQSAIAGRSGVRRELAHGAEYGRELGRA